MSHYPSSRFETPFFNSLGIPYMGVIQPIEDQKLYNDDYFYHRQILRVEPNLPKLAGQVILDHIGQHFLLGALDTTVHYVSYQMYLCTDIVTWRRETAVVDTLTGLQKSVGEAPVGPGQFWGLVELLNREVSSRNIKAAEETKRVLTGEPVQLNDVVNGMRVKKINMSHGIRVLEVV